MFAFVSDIHLNEPHSKRYGAFLHLLDNVHNDDAVEALFLVGDVFDLWLGDRKIFVKMHKQVLEKIEAVAKKKTVHYFEGNHDFQLGRLWRDMGVKVYPGEHEFLIKGKKVLVSHGDLLNQEDKVYLKLRWFFRTSLVKTFIKIFPNVVLFKIGSVLSTTEQKEPSTEEQKNEFLSHWQKWTKQLYHRHPYDIFICGHYHFDVDITFKDTGARAVNLGTWLDGDFKVFSL